MSERFTQMDFYKFVGTSTKGMPGFDSGPFSRSSKQGKDTCI